MKSSKLVKSKIIKTSSNLFYTQGYNSTGINQIIDEANIAKATLYYHFKSKNELLYTYLEETNKNWFAELDKYLEKINDPKDKILGLFDFRIERQVKNGFRGCPFIKAGAEIPSDDKKAFKIIDNNKMKFRNLILDTLKNITPKCNFLTKEELADTIYLLVEGATLTASFQKRKLIIDNAKEITKKLL